MKNLAWVTGIALLLACNPPSASERDQLKETRKEASQPASANSRPHSCQMRVRDFLVWYPNNAERFSSSTILNSPSGATTKPAYFALDAKRLDAYLARLDSAGFFSQNFIAAKRTEILAKGQALAALKLADGPPPGFDYDLLLYTQELYEPDYVAQLRKASRSQSVYELPIMKRKWTFATVEENGKCVIDRIEYK